MFCSQDRPEAGKSMRCNVTPTTCARTPDVEHHRRGLVLKFLVNRLAEEPFGLTSAELASLNPRLFAWQRNSYSTVCTVQKRSEPGPVVDTPLG